MNLSPRLCAAASLVRPHSRVADIGCDHALLSIYLLQNGIAHYVVASDIGQNPLDIARQNIALHDVQNIDLRIGDGLSQISSDEVDDIVIAGMGGENIAKIIGDAAWLKNPEHQLILQPMTRHVFLRKFLANHGFYISDEVKIEEKKHTYVLMRAYFDPQKSASQKNDFFYTFGLLESDEKYRRKHQAKLEELLAIYKNIGDNDNAAKTSAILEKLANKKPLF